MISKKKIKKKLLSNCYRIKPSDDINSGAIYIVNDKYGWCCIQAEWSYTSKQYCPKFRGKLLYSDDLNRPTWVDRQSGKIWKVVWNWNENLRNFFNYNSDDLLPLSTAWGDGEGRDWEIQRILSKFKCGRIYRHCNGEGGQLRIVSEFLLVNVSYNSWGNIEFQAFPMYTNSKELQKYYFRKVGDMKYIIDITDEVTKSEQTFFRQWAKLSKCEL